MKKTLTLTSYPQLFWLAIILSMSLGQLTRVSLNAGNFAIYLHDIFLSVWFFVGVVPLLWQINLGEKLDEAQEFFKKHPIPTLIILALIIWQVGSLLWVFDPSALAKTLRLALYIVSGLTLGWALRDKKECAEGGWWLYGSLIIWFGILQYAFVPDLRSLHILGWDDHLNRLAGSFLDPNFTGGFLALFTVSLLNQLFSYHDQKSTKKSGHSFVIIALVFSIAALVLTFSRSSLLAVLAGSVYIFLTHSNIRIRPKSILFFVALSIGTFAAFFSITKNFGGEGTNFFRTSTIVARAQAASAIVTQLQPTELLFGKGFFVSRTIQAPTVLTSQESHASIADSWPLFLIESTGLAGLTLFIWLLYSWWKKDTTSSDHVALVITLLTHGLFVASVVYPFILVPLLVKLANKT